VGFSFASWLLLVRGRDHQRRAASNQQTIGLMSWLLSLLHLALNRQRNTTPIVAACMHYKTFARKECTGIDAELRTYSLGVLSEKVINERAQRGLGCHFAHSLASSSCTANNLLP